jgi:hypothetical protein
MSGQVTAAGITWACARSTCTVTGPWPEPGLGACSALAQRVGAINAYGHPGRQLTASQLKQCNAGLKSDTAEQPSPVPSEQKTESAAYDYFAKTTGQVAMTGVVRAAGVDWTCSGSSCAAELAWPDPDVKTCKALAQRVGPIGAYGRSGKQLSASQLRQCNAGLKSDTAQQPSPPPPSEQKTDSVAYDYFAKTMAQVAMTGLVRAAGIDWQCSGSTCTAELASPEPDIKTCQALAQRVGSIGAYGRSGRQLSASELGQCNKGQAVAFILPGPPPKKPGKPVETAGADADADASGGAAAPSDAEADAASESPAAYALPSEPTSSRDGSLLTISTAGLTATGAFDAAAVGPRVTIVPEPLLATGTFVAPSGPRMVIVAGTLQATGSAGSPDAGRAVPSLRISIATPALVATGMFDAGAPRVQLVILTETLLASGTFVAPSGPRIVIATPPLQASGIGDAP